MKKIYTTPHKSAVSNFKNSCSSHGLPFIRTLSLVSVAVFLSNASPVSACDTWGNVAKYFGGGADIRRSIAPTYVIDGKVYRDVGSAFTGVGDSFQRWKNEVNANINNKFNQFDNKINQLISDKFVRQNSSGTILIGANTHGIAVDFANSSRESRILMGVRDGMVGPRSDQAVNGNQLYNLGSGVANSLGGGAYYSNGKWSAPVFMIKAFDEYGNQTLENHKSVAGAFGSMNNSFANLNKAIKNVVANAAGDGLIQQDSAGIIKIGAKKWGAIVDFANNSHEARLITGVRNGVVNATSNYAVNGSQLYELGAGVAKSFGGNASYKDGKWSAPTFTVKVFDENGKGANKNYHNVADAFTGVNSSFTNLDKKIENVVINATGNSLVKQDDTGLITIGGKVSGTKVSIANIDNAARILSGVNAGSITATSHDAINGSQLYSMSNVVAGYFGGNASYKDGKWSAPTFTVKVFDENGKGADKSYHNVADAFTGVNSSFTNLDKKIENVVINATGNSLVKQDDTGLITIGGEVSGTKVSIANADNAARILSGVDAGSITATSNDAINGSQLYSMSKVIAGYFGGNASYEDGKWSAPTFTVKVFDENGNGADKNYHNVADAFTGVSGSFTNIDKKIENVVTNVVGDKLVKQDTAGLITIGGEVGGANVSIANVDNAARTLSGVNAGSITATSTDAINGSQLYSMSKVVAGYFGGNASYEDGKWSAPTFTVKVFDENGKGADKEYHNVADAFTGVNSSFTSLDKKIENVVTNVVGDSLVKQNDTGLITIGGEVSGTKVSIANVDKAARILSGVDAGSITAISNDAINGAQLYSMSNSVARYFSGDAGYDEDGNWNAPSFTVKVLDENGNGAETHYENVADALSGVSSSFTNLNKKIESVTGDSFIKQNSAGLITIGGSKSGNRIDIANNVNAPRVLSGVKGGAFTKNSTEAVNGSQIYFMSQAFANYFGGGAGYNEEGKWSGPTFTVKVFDKDGNESEKKYNNVADAFSGVNSAFTVLNEEIVKIKNNTGIDEKSHNSEDGDLNDIISEGFPFMRSLPRALGDLKDATTVTVAAKSPLKQISFMNSKGESRRLFDIAAGEISETSTDAVTGSQLYSMNNQIATYFGGGSGYKNGNWISPTFTIKAFDEHGHETENTYTSVADAFAGVNSAFTALNNQIVDIKDNVGIGETEKASQNGDSDIISEGFPFMRSVSLVRSLPFDMDEEEYAMGDDVNLPSVTVSPEIESTQVSLMTASGKKRSLFGLVNGDISANSDEAINGSQLFSLGSSFASYLGGDVKYENGIWKAPSFKAMVFTDDGSVIDMQSYGDVAGAFDAVRKGMLAINKRLVAVEQKEAPGVASNGFPWDEGKKGYDASHDGKPSKIVNVKGGALVEGSTEVVNGGQLWTTNEKVTEVETKVATVEKKVTEVETKVAAVENKVNLAVSYDVDKDSGKKINSITLKGADDSEPVLITNVKDGEIKKGSKDAVNGGQLHNHTEEKMKITLSEAQKYTDERVNGLVNNSVNEAKSYTDMKFDALSYDITNVRKEARQAAAIGLAVSNLRYFDDPGSVSVSFGGGFWRGQSAFAIGAGYTSEDGKIRSNLSATSAGGQWGVGGGITLKLR
ncbi:YadA-like family protein [Bartonella sp. AU18XJBT]|uniref:YadA-like family protein n=1 Tax=Bartonella sp. AU18XJBT TaxID=3019089 RepID=UPI002360B1F1|nr:YadA-like family protein [Bartonella sp. AU18XJBT]